MTETISRSRFPLYAIMAVFIVPMIAAWILYHYHNHFHFGRVNHGTLILPPKKMAISQHHWQVIYVPAGHCDQKCLALDHQLHQMKKLLGEKSRRVVVGRQAKLADLTAGRIYLVDPVGNLFMYYSQSVNPLDILQDLKRLLEVSQIG